MCLQTMDKNEINMDNLIRTRIQDFGGNFDFIKPSQDFKKRTMAKIYRIERSRRRLKNIFIAGLFLSPFIARQAWLIVRGDYFSVARLPLGDFIAGAYQMFISPASAYALLAFGIFCAWLYFFRIKQYNPLY